MKSMPMINEAERRLPLWKWRVHRDFRFVLFIEHTFGEKNLIDYAVMRFLVILIIFK